MQHQVTLFFTLTLLTGFNMIADAQENVLKDMIGIYEEIPSRDSIKSIIHQGIMDMLPEEEPWKKRYDTLPKHKSIAIGYGSRMYRKFLAVLMYSLKNINSNITDCFAVWDYKKTKQAIKGALEECKKDTLEDNFKCFTIMIDDSLIIPETLIDEYINTYKECRKKRTEILEKAKKIYLIDNAFQSIGFLKKDSMNSYNISTHQPLHVGYPDEQQDYAYACQKRVLYALKPIKNNEINQVKLKLDSICNAHFYGEYYRSVNTVFDFLKSTPDSMAEKMCHFSNHFKFISNPVKDSSIILPTNLEEALKEEVIEEIWVESSVRITEKGTPLVIDDKARPLAIMTDKGFYLGIQIKTPDPGHRCYVSKPFTNKVVQFSVCIDDISCAEKVQNILFETIQKNLFSDPIGATIIQDGEFGPGEFWMERQFKPSLVLGSPYYERTTYTVQSFVADKDDPWYSLYDRFVYKGVNKGNNSLKKGKELYLFLKVNYILTYSAHKNGTYSEPNEMTIKKYNETLHKVIEKSLSEACVKLQGNMNSSICEILNKQ
jgi:hypothetical protein